MCVFIAGAISTGAFVARYSEVRKSSAIPLANFPMMLAVAGATSRRSMLDASEICSMSEFAPGSNWLVNTRCRVIASNVSSPTNFLRRPSHHRNDVVPLLLKATDDLDGLVGADSAAHAQSNHRHKISHARLARHWKLFRISSAFGRMQSSFERSASTMPLTRSTHASNSSLITT